MTGLTATNLAKEMQLSKGRISQLVGGGTFDGCYEGDGRQRRFDLARCLAAYKGLDPGQRLGNGAKTQKAIEGLTVAPTSQEPKTVGVSKLTSDDDDGYQLARTQKAIEEARKLRRQNAEAEGEFVLASEVARQTKKAIGQEIAQFESVLRDGARKIADELGVDFKQARAILLTMWRDLRTLRSKALAHQSELAEFSDTESEEDI